MMHIYDDHAGSGEWIRCNLLHEFMECYQIEFKDPSTGQEVEKIVRRELVREVHDTGERRYG